MKSIKVKMDKLEVQTLITCTGVDDFVNKRFSINKILKVEQGHVMKEN